MTNLGVATQANGFWAAFIKSAGYDAVIIQGQSPRWVYLHIGEGKAELRDAAFLRGKTPGRRKRRSDRTLARQRG